MLIGRQSRAAAYGGGALDLSVGGGTQTVRPGRRAGEREAAAAAAALQTEPDTAPETGVGNPAGRSEQLLYLRGKKH